MQIQNLFLALFVVVASLMATTSAEAAPGYRPKYSNYPKYYNKY